MNFLKNIGNALEDAAERIQGGYDGIEEEAEEILSTDLGNLAYEDLLDVALQQRDVAKSLRTKYLSTKASNAKLTRQLDTQTANCETLQKNVFELNEYITELAEKEQERAEGITRDDSDASGRISELLSEIEKLREEGQDCLNQLQMATQKEVTLRAEFDIQIRQLTVEKEKLAAGYEERLGSLQAQEGAPESVIELERKVSEAEAAHTLLKRVSERWRTQAQDKANEAATLLAQVRDNKETLRLITAELHEARAVEARLQDSLEALLKQKEEAQAQAAASNAAFEQLMSQVNSNKDQIENLMKTHSEPTITLERHESCLTELVTLRANEKNAEAKFKEMEERMAQLSQEKDDMEFESSAAMERCEMLEKEVMELTAQNTALELKYQREESEVEQMARGLRNARDTRDGFERQVKESQLENEKLKQKIEQLGSESQKSEKEIDELACSLRKAHMEMKQLERQLHDHTPVSQGNSTLGTPSPATSVDYQFKSPLASNSSHATYAMDPHEALLRAEQKLKVMEQEQEHLAASLRSAREECSILEEELQSYRGMMREKGTFKANSSANNTLRSSSNCSMNSGRSSPIVPLPSLSEDVSRLIKAEQKIKLMEDEQEHLAASLRRSREEKTTLEEQVETLKGLREQNALLEDQVQALKTQFEGCNQKSENEETNRTIEVLNNKVVELESDLEVMAMNLRNAKGEIQSYEEKLLALQEKFHEQAMANADLQEQAKASKSTVADAMDVQAQEHAAQLQTLKHENKFLTTQVDKLQTKLNLTLTELNDSASRISEAGSSKEQAFQKMKEREEEAIRKLKALEGELKEVHALELETEKAERQRQVQAFESKVLSLEEACKKLSMDLTLSRRSTSKLETTVQELQAEKATFEEKISAMASATEAEQARGMMMLREEAESAQSALQAHESRVAEMEEQMRTMNGEMHTKDTMCSNLQAQVYEMERELEQAQVACRELEMQNEVLSGELERVTADALAQKEEQRNRELQASQQNHLSQQDVEQHEDELKELQLAIADRESKLNHVLQTLTTKQQEIQSMEHQMEETHTKLNEANLKIQSLCANAKDVSKAHNPKDMEEHEQLRVELTGALRRLADTQAQLAAVSSDLQMDLWPALVITSKALIRALQSLYSFTRRNAIVFYGLAKQRIQQAREQPGPERNI